MVCNLSHEVEPVIVTRTGTGTENDTHLDQIGRRHFLKQCAGLGICFAFTHISGSSRAGSVNGGVAGPMDFTPNVWINITSAGSVRILAPVDELGQGSMTTLPLIVAEELDVSWSDVHIELSPPDEALYGNPAFMGMMYAVESVAVSGYFDKLRYCGAQARKILLMNAAANWRVPVAELSTRPSIVLHKNSGQTMTYAEIAQFAQLPENLPEIEAKDLKSASEFRLIGYTVPRRDIPAKVLGNSDYSIDQQLPDMVYATAVRAPVRGANISALDDSVARTVPGLIDILPRKHSVVIVAKNFFSAITARRKLRLQWSRVGEVNDFDSDFAVKEHMMIASDLRIRGATWKQQGNGISAINSAHTVIAGSYLSDYVYHAQIEPMNAVVWVKKGAHEVEAWAGTQAPAIAVKAIARSTGIEPGRITLHRTMVGGAFGRRAVKEMDFIDDAAWLSKRLERPVKVIWSRTDDLAAGWFKPMTGQYLRAALDEQGDISVWHHRIAVQEPLTTAEPELYQAAGRKPLVSMSGSGDLLYDIHDQLVEHLAMEPGIRTYPLLGVGHTPNLFATESFIDEIAVAGNTDPLEFRLRHLQPSTRAMRVLNAVADMADWERPMDNNCAKGIAFAYYKGTLLAGAAEVSIMRTGIRVHEFWVAIDPGIAVQPDNIRAQVMGAVVFGLGNALTERITFKNGLVQQANYNDYLVPKMNEIPRIHIELLPSGTRPTAVGQTAAVLVAPAIANAFAKLSGKRLRHMPFTTDRVNKALAS